MASVFLSYVHEDADKARALAGLIEQAGHSVWWDRHIKGGAQFSQEIERALNAADRVVVLWSAASVNSAWVRDEAAAGRDSGRLLPITLDDTSPPLGFRQFQTIVLTKWKGRSAPANLDELLDTIGDTGPSPVTTPAPRPAQSRWKIDPRALGAALVLLLILAAAGWWWTGRSSGGSPAVAVTASNGDPQSQSAAHQLAVSLGDFQTTRAGPFRLISGKGRSDITLDVRADDNEKTRRRDLSVVSGADHSILWSTSLEQPADKASDLDRQVSLTAQRVLICAIDALANPTDRIQPPILKLYVNACLGLEGLYGNAQYNPELISSFEQVVAAAPHFERGWAQLLSTEYEIAVSPDPPPALVDNLRRHIAQAERLGIKIGEIDISKAALLPTSDFLGRLPLYDRAIKDDPNNPFMYRTRSERLLGVGRIAEAVADATRALQLDPNSPAVQDNYFSALAYSGQTDAAFVQLRKSEAMWPNAKNIRYARFRLDIRYGDPKEALSIYASDMAGGSSSSIVDLLNARIDPTPANVQHAIDTRRAVYRQDSRDIQGLLQALAQFGRTDEAIQEMLNYPRPDATGFNSETMFRPAMRDVWRDPRSIAAAAHMGLLKYWVKSGKWPDFCSDPTLPYDCRKEAAKYPV